MRWSAVKGMLGAGRSDDEGREVTGPQDMRVGDLVEFGFLPIPEISNRRLEVRQINDVDYGYGARKAFVLSDGSNTIGLSFETGDQGTELVVSRVLPRQQVLQLFNPERFALVFEQGLGNLLELMERPENLAPWLDEIGYQESADAVPARFREGSQGQWYGFDFYELIGGDDDNFTLEIEVYDDETEVFACRSLRPDAIEKIWPAGN